MSGMHPVSPNGNLDERHHGNVAAGRTRAAAPHTAVVM